MANLLGQNIGTNYKGILNLNTLNGNLSGTLESVTDGDGNASPLQLSTSSSLISTPDVGFFVGSSIVEIRRNTLNYFRSVNAAASAFVDLQFDVRNAYYQFNAGNGLGLGITSGASACLHVRGDGTNPIARFEDNTGSPMLRIENSLMRFGSSTPFGSLQFAMTGTTISSNNNGTGLGFYSQFSIAGSSDRYDFGFGGDAVANTAGVVSHLALVRNFAAGAGSASFRPLNIAYTINNSGAQTGTATGIFLNATETALNGMTHNLMDLQRGGVSQFRISVTDATIYASNYNISASVYLGNSIAVSSSGGVKIGSSRIRSDADANLTLLNDAANNFSLLKFGGTTNAFPALKRNGAALEVRLADDSGFANLSCAALTNAGEITLRRSDNSEVMSYFNAPNALDFGSGLVRVRFQSQTVAINSLPDTSAALTIASTTRGFLPPRMTEAQRLAIAGGTPAIGLMVYQTDASDGLYVYKAGGWTLII